MTNLKGISIELTTIHSQPQADNKNTPSQAATGAPLSTHTSVTIERAVAPPIDTSQPAAANDPFLDLIRATGSWGPKDRSQH